MKTIFNNIVNHPILTLLFVILFVAPFIYYMPQLKTANNIDYVTVENNEEIEYYNFFKEEFGTEELFVIAFKQDDIFQTKWLTVIQEITNEIESWPSVEDVYSLTNVDDILGTSEYFEVKKFMETIPDDSTELLAKKEFAVNNPIYKDLIISHDAQTAAIVIEPVLDDVEEEFRRSLMDRVNKLLKPYEVKHGIKFYIAGQTFINLRLGESIVRDMSKFIPISYVAMVIIAAIIFMNLRIALLSFFNILATLICTFGFMAMANITMNNFTGLAPTIIMALSLASAIHVFSHYKHHQHTLEPKQALVAALLETYKPSLFTVVTTGIGFASLTISHIPPIREFGIIAAVGISFIFIFTFVFLPALMTLVIRKPLPKRDDLHQRMRGWLDKLSLFVRQYAKPIFWFNIVLVLIALSLITRIPVETNLVDWFKSGTDVQINNDFIDENLAPISELAISLKGEEDTFKYPKHLIYLDELQQYLNTLPDVHKTLSFTDFIKDMNQSFHDEDTAYYRIPESKELVAQYLIMYNSDDIEEYINSDYSHARLLIRSIHHSSKDLKTQVDVIKAYLKSNPPASGISVRVTDEGVESIEIARELVDNQVITLIITIISISVLMFLVFLSWKLGFVSLIPNLFPVILNFGLMGLLKMPLNSGTALISATVFGIVVDDTIHLLYHYQKERKAGITIKESIHRSMIVKGSAVITTSAILFCGFIVAVQGTMMPVIQFGILTSIIMITALLGDLIFLPAVLYLQKSQD